MRINTFNKFKILYLCLKMRNSLSMYYVVYFKTLNNNQSHEYIHIIGFQVKNKMP